MPALTIAHAVKLLSSSQAEARVGTTHPSGTPYPTRGLTNRTAPLTKIAADAQSLELILRRLLYAMELHVEEVDGAALQVAVVAGNYAKSDGTKVSFAGSTGYSVPDNTTGTKLWIDVATNTLDSDTAWPASEADYFPLAEIDTANGAITAIADRRNLCRNRIAPSGLDAGTTSATDFVVDYDNAGVGVNSQIRFNRGSTDAEDAAWQWDEANDRFNAKTQHTTGTLAPVNVAKLQIAGTDVVTLDGAAKVAPAVAGDGLAHSSGVLSVGVDGATLEINADALRIKDAGVTAAKLSDALADTLVQISVGDASGSGSTLNVTIQAQDKQGNSLAEAVYLEVGVFQDADGAAAATNATIDNSPVAGTFIAWETTSKIGRYKTNSSGTLTLDIGMPNLETVYVLVRPTRRSRMMDCSDIGTVTRS